MLQPHRHAKTAVALLATMLFGLPACTPSAPNAAAAPTTPPPIEGRTPTDYRKIDASAPAMPDWVLTIPDDSDNQHFLVALSEYHASEQDARDTALKNARREYAQFTGVEISDVDEVIRAMYGVSSDVFDPTVAGRAKTSQKTDAQVSRIKAKQWYFEKYQASKGKVAQGQVFKYWVLVSVPIDEYDRVQAWRKQKSDDLVAAQQKRDDAAKTELAQQLQTHRDKLAEIQRNIDGGEPVLALAAIKAEWDRLYEVEKRFNANGSPYLEMTDKLRTAQRNVTSLVGQVRAALQIDCGRSGTISATSSARGYPVPAWACAKTSTGRRPLPNLPLILVHQNGEVMARAITDRTGRGEFHLNQLEPGRYRIGLDLESGILATLDKGIAESLAVIENHVTVTPAENEFEAAIHNAVVLLFAGQNQSTASDYRVILGPVTYGSSRQGTELSLEVQQQLRKDLTRMQGLSVIEPRPRDTNVVAQAITRGIAIQKNSTESAAATAPNLGAASFQAVIDGADAALETNYDLRGDAVKFDLTLRQAGTDMVLSAAPVSIPRSAIPNGIEVIPALASTPLPPMTIPTATTIRLQVTSHLGDGQTYREGDAISYFVNSDRDAHLLLIYEDAAHNLIQILPNRYSDEGFFRAGNLLQIPAPNDRFEFVITAPFGTEKVWAFASSRPFPPPAGDPLENGLTLLRGNLNGIVQSLRRTGQAAGNAYGEAQAIITTVAKH
jgi:hypothetical protein